MQELARLYPYLLACRGAYLRGAVWLLGTNGLALAIPWLLKLAVESLERPASASHPPAFYALLIVATALAQGGIRILSRITLLNAGRQIEFALRDDLYAQLLRLDQSYFSASRTGDLLSRFANDLTNLRMLLGFGALNVINTAIVYSAAILLMTRLSPSLTLFALLPFPLMVVAVQRLSAAMYRRSKRAQEELARLSSQIEENVAAAVLVRAYAREAAEEAACREAGQAYLESNMAMARLRGAMIPLMAATGAIGTLVVLFVGGRQVIGGQLTLGDFVAFSGYLAMLVWPTLMLGWILNLLQRGAASMVRLAEVLEARPQVREPAEPLPVQQLHGAIEFRHLDFAYAGQPVLRDISLRIAAGEKLGIVGPIGAGKSTLVKLVARLYPVPDNCLFLDGQEINRLPVGLVRAAVGYVPQEGFLFSRSLAENIAFGRPDASPEEVAAAARRASLTDDVARFPDGFATLVGERGVTLSGGQKQRTAIARALLRAPTILILDDPLSAVDSRTETAILEELAGFAGERTLLVVSHRLSAVRDCDRIIVLDEGRIVEEGSHAALLAAGGRYAAIHREQQLREEIEKL